MTESTIAVIDFLKSISPFEQMDESAVKRIVELSEPLRYRMGQPILSKESLPTLVNILYKGKARLVGYPPGADAPETLELLEPGAIIGVTEILRGVSCCTALASTESTCLTIKAGDFLKLLSHEPTLKAAFCNRTYLSEVYHLLGAEQQRWGKTCDDLLDLSKRGILQATVLNLPPGKTRLRELDSKLTWFISSNDSNYPIASQLNEEDNKQYIQSKDKEIRLIGFSDPTLEFSSSPQVASYATSIDPNPWDNAPFAQESPSEPEEDDKSQPEKYPFVRGKGLIDVIIACFQMLSQYWGIPFKRDVIKRALVNNYQRTGNISIELCGAVAELMGLKATVVEVTHDVIHKLSTPILIPWQETFAIIYYSSEKELIIAVPEVGIVRRKPIDFVETWGESGKVLLLQSTPETPKKRFSLSWFVPAIKKHKVPLIEVFIASLFVQMLGLANPLITQVIIDKVIVQNSIGTLNIVGTVVLVIAFVEAWLTWLRTVLFVDTTNRIDLSLGSEVIDHLLRLPLRYFEKRSVGEVSSRINELENIRSFLTGTALTVVLDAIFSVVYIVIMVFYSWLLTIVALATVPLFAILTLVFAPIRGKYSEAVTRGKLNSLVYVSVEG